MRFALKASFADGFQTVLSETFASQEAAERAASRYIRDHRPLFVGGRVVSVAIIDLQAEAA